MTGLIRPITALLCAAAIAIMGSGLMGVLVPMRATLANFSNIEIGILGSFYWIGLTLGCFISPFAIFRVGHIRAFVAFTATVTITPLVMSLISDPMVWSGLRLVNGICFAGIQMVIESWLAAASTDTTRGRIFGIYTFLNLTVTTIGMQLIILAPPLDFQLLILVAILFSLAAVPIALSSSMAPSTPKSVKLHLRWLMQISPASVVGCFCTGVTGGAFWAMTPLYALETGFTPVEGGALMTLVVLAGAIGQLPIGWLSDRVGRRQTLVAVSFAAALTCFAVFSLSTNGRDLVWPAAAIFGMFAFASYPLGVAHANDLVDKSDAVAVSGGLLLIYSIAAISGPLFASAAMYVFGPHALFPFMAAVYALTAVVILLRVQVRPELPEEHQEVFVPIARTTPAAFALDPRVEPEEALDVSGPEPPNPADSLELDSAPQH
ncbi:Twin-arginine translocation pathway signal [Candidatus Filomicrobium marinum]|uniref:Twin-arginine translocation pathway signal n=1 Tax=Candidatus Filomicrobium marinum TaxID=1608628 RepID=A0A0D6JLN8_9HYPH|nr:MULTISPECIES: MFS transporter [Filomicrobium]MCV0368990.1 MFS transporter [Filomicrobium sp.]CFX64635.1 Twin-arginine translocation pathway signal [Candidatus Filomicrobium marinum]CPR22602.1 Twin-arginine translocation pathway signal [Candidatus Filomicrobium marinum]